MTGSSHETEHQRIVDVFRDVPLERQMQHLAGRVNSCLVEIDTRNLQRVKEFLDISAGARSQRRNRTPNDHAEILHQVAMKLLEDLKQLGFLLR